MLHPSILDVGESVFLGVDLHVVRTAALEAVIDELLVLNVRHVLEALAALAVDESGSHASQVCGAVAFRADVALDRLIGAERVNIPAGAAFDNQESAVAVPVVAVGGCLGNRCVMALAEHSCNAAVS